MKTELFTETLKLVTPDHSDANDLFRLRTDPLVNKYILRRIPQTIQDVEEFIEQRILDPKDYYFVIKTLPELVLVGTIGLKDIDHRNKYAEVGYELFPNFQGKGIMTTALRKIIHFAFEEIGIATLEAMTHMENLSSRRLLEHFNFKIIPGKVDPDNSKNVIYCLKKV